MKLNILITGASGFVGSHLAKALQDHNLYLLTHQNTLPEIKREWIIADLSKGLEVGKLPKKLDVIIHQAALAGSNVGEESWRINVEGTRNLLEYGKKIRIKKFLFASSVAVYGMRKGKISEDSVLKPESLYAETKVVAEKVVGSFSNFFDTLIFRYNDPYGVGGKFGIVSKLKSKLDNGEEIILFNNGENPKSNPIYIDDLVETTIKSFELTGSYKINLGGPETKSAKKVVEILSRLMKKSPKYVNKVDSNVKNRIVDISLMTELLGVPKTGLEEGIKKILLDLR